MDGQEGEGPATLVAIPPDRDGGSGKTESQKQALVKGPDEANAPAENHLFACWSQVAARIRRVDRRLCYMFCMFLSTLHPVLALYMVAYKDCPLDDLGNPIPDYQPPPPCALDADGEKADPNCIDPPRAYARVENILYMYLANEFALHVTYVLYVKVWTLGGRNVGFWREMSGYVGYFIIEFLSNAALYHVQTFPRVREVLPFFNHFTWPLYAAFIFGSILLIPLGLYLAKTRDQYRRALIFHLPGIVFFGVDVFNRTVFLPFFETMQHKFAQLQLSAVISFIGELALANFYGSIFLPATHKATNILVEFGYNVSYQTGQELPSVEEVHTEEFLQQDSEEGVRVLLELEGPSNSDILKQSSADFTAGLGLGKARNQKLPSSMQGSSEGQYRGTPMEDNFSGGEIVQRTQRDRNGSAATRRSGRTFEQRSRGSRLGSKASTFSAAARQSRILAPIVASVDYIPPSQPHVPIRPDGPDPLEFDKILCCFAIVWDSWRYLLIRTVLMKASSIFLYLLMVFKDFAFSYFHFWYAYMERRVLLVIEGATTEESTVWSRIKKLLVWLFKFFIVKPFFLTKFLATTVWRTEIIFGMNERRQHYSHNVYEEPSPESSEENISFRKTIRLVNARKPTASDWASALSTVAVQKGKHTRGFVGSLFSDMWTHFVLNLRRDWRHWKAKDFSRYTHPVEHWKKKLTASKTEAQNGQGAKFDGLEVRYCFANECCIIRHVPPKPKTHKIRSGSQMVTGAEEPQRPSGESVFRRINAVWLSKVVKEIQSLIFNRCWPRILQKLVSSTVFVITELFTQHSTVGLLPSYQEVRTYQI